jgi:hypothetical protein
MLPAVIKDISKHTLFADDINLILTTSDSMQFKENLNIALGKIMRWFQANSLTLNFNKTYYMYFKTKMSQIDNSQIKYTTRQINSTHYIDFLGVILDSTLSWQGHINKVITKLNSACFAIRALTLFLTIENLKIVYFAYVYSIITYGLAFWGNATNSKNVFIVNPKASCRGLFTGLNILPFFSQYVFFIVIGSKKYIAICV